jgi:hypothetical protein
VIVTLSDKKVNEIHESLRKKYENDMISAIAQGEDVSQEQIIESVHEKEAVKHHFVAASYGKRFCVNGEKFFYSLHKKTGNISEASPKNMNQYAQYYEVELENGRKINLEKLFAFFEEHASEVLKILEWRPDLFNEFDKCILSAYIALQYLRTPRKQGQNGAIFKVSEDVYKREGMQPENVFYHTKNLVIQNIFQSLQEFAEIMEMKVYNFR